MSFLAAFIDRQFIHYPPVQTVSFNGKTIIVTGGSGGLGLAACKSLVNLGAERIIIACRNQEKGKAAAKDIQNTTSCSSNLVEVWPLDLSSYASVQVFAGKAKELPRLDVVLGNAGIGTRTFRITEDNEETITTNIISLFLLAFLIYPKLRESALKYNTQTYFSVTSSELYEVAAFKESKVPVGQIFATLNDKKTANMNDRYNVSKLLGIFMVKQMAAMFPLQSNKVVINCTAPGLCHSELHREVGDGFIVRLLLRIFARPTEVGARTLVHGASAGPESHGQYVPDCKITATKGLTLGEDGKHLQARVWQELKVKLEGIQKGVTDLS